MATFLAFSRDTTIGITPTHIYEFIYFRKTIFVLNHQKSNIFLRFIY